MCEITKKLLPLYHKTQKIITQIRKIKAQKDHSENDFENLALLQTELLELCPPKRYLWVDGKPQADIVTELIKIERGCNHD